MNSWEVLDHLGEIAEPPLSVFAEGYFVHYGEDLDLVELGPGLCFVAFELIEPDDWYFVARVDRTDSSKQAEAWPTDHGQGVVVADLFPWNTKTTIADGGASQCEIASIRSSFLAVDRSSVAGL